MTSQSQSRENKYRRINKIVILLYLILSVLVFFYYQKRGWTYNSSQALLAIGMLLIPLLFNKISKIKLSSDCSLIYYLFSFLTVIVGSALNGYSKLPCWDKIMHSLSGVLITVVGFIVFHFVSKTKRKLEETDLKLVGYFVFFFNTAIAGLWEIYEYGLYVFFGIDAQNVLTTGIHDTMQDMIVCVVAGLLTQLYLIIKIKHKKNSFFLSTYTHFLAYNHYLTSTEDNKN